LVTNAERYYRSMFRGREESWNLSDNHMTETLAALIGHFDSGRSKVIVWAHNSHLGDARATEMSARGECNVGQLTRERFGERVFGIGFSTYYGTVTAARDWGDPAECRRVRPACRGATKNFFMRPKCRDSGSICARPTPRRSCSANAGFSARSGLFTGQKPSGGAITLRHAYRNNSTR
jgi:erythromycin esterase-like protein